MNQDYIRHRLLKLLTIQFTESQNTNIDVGLSYSSIENKLNIKRGELYIVTAELFSNKEIQLYNPTGDKNKLGICITNTGVSSFSNKFYKNKFFNTIKSRIKDFLQIVIPVLSLAIAFYTIKSKIDSINEKNVKKIESLETKTKFLERQILNLERKSSIPNNGK